jgi:hypothetical protein
MPRTLVARLVYCSSLLALGCGGESSDSAAEPKAADKAPEAPADPPPPKVEPPKPPPFEWHVAMKLPAEREFDYSRTGELPLVVGEDTYWVDAGKNLIELKRGSTEPPKVVALGGYLDLFGVHADELFLIGDEAVHVLPKAGGAPTKRFDVGTMNSPTIVGDRLVLRSWKDDKDFLHHAPIAGGEFTTLELEGNPLERRPVVRGDAMLLVLDWAKVVRLSGDLSKPEVVYEPASDQPNQYVRDVAFAGDAIVVVVGEVDDDPTLTLVRQAPDGTRTELQSVPGDKSTMLVGDGERAYWQVREQGTWLVDAQTVQQVDLGDWASLAAGTSAGLAWLAGSEIRLASAGTAGPELPADAFDKPTDFSDLDRLGVTKVSGSNKVIGPMDVDIVRRIARVHLSDVRKCRAKGKKSNPELSGSIAMSFIIGPEGTVSDVAAVEGPNSGNQELVGCLVAEIGTWTFPKPGRGGKAKVVHTIGFDTP